MVSLRRILAAQGALYVTAGLWPVVHLRSFAAVTGSKPEGWLVKTVGGLLAVVGASLIVDRQKPSPSTRFLSVGTASVLAAVDFFYAGKRRISPVYFIDGALQTVIVALSASATRQT